MADNFFSEEIGYEPKIDFDTPKIIIQNGSPEMIDELEAIKQWIFKFCITEKDTMSIYEGTGFGCRIKQLYGRKRIGYGYEEAELERDFTEGLPLCPAISRVSSFELSKEGKALKINLQVELYNSDLIDVSIEDIWTFKR